MNPLHEIDTAVSRSNYILQFARDLASRVNLEAFIINKPYAPIFRGKVAGKD